VAQKSKPLSRINRYFFKPASAATFLIKFEYKMSTIMLYVFIKYSMRDLICDATRLKTRKNRENMEIKDIFT